MVMVMKLTHYWKLWAKIDKLFIKQFEEETNLNVILFLIKVLQWLPSSVQQN